jgi:hypothetical protein
MQTKPADLLFFRRVSACGTNKDHGVVVGVDDLPLVQERKDARHRGLTAQEAETDSVFLKKRIRVALQRFPTIEFTENA